ncbi:MAG: His-Xaa-Ser system protein HxsD [archaeon]|nr:MAG: His-Xaa-Ser system protein HxsD [archaeon]
MSLPEKLENFKINQKENSIIISVNPKIYALEVIYSAAYMFLDKVYVIIDGDPENQVLIQLKAKNEGENLKKLAEDFNNELINYSVYVVQAARTGEIREAIVKRALGVVEEDLWEKDPEGIAEPWKPEKAEGLEEE